MSRPEIACLGAGRMGRGIAVAFAYAGHEVRLVDLKGRPAEHFARLKAETLGEVRRTLGDLAAIGLFEAAEVERLATRVSVVPAARREPALAASLFIFEGVPEVVALKREALAEASRHAAPDAVIASTTSTILVDDLADAVLHPERFLNAHWLNPAYIVPLVELSPGRMTHESVTVRLKALLEGIGKVPVTCRASPGYIVPRIQALAMNEAARLVEEGVASAEDVDRAVRYGFGFRFAVLGLLEFVDWGGGDILHYASRYLEQSLGEPRFRAPEIIGRNMSENRIGLRTRQGFLSYEDMDVAAYQRERIAALVRLLGHLGLERAPVLDD